MNQQLQTFYNPFKGSAFSFYWHNNDFQNHSYFNTIDDIDLYQQPVEEPITAIIFFAVRCIIVVLAEICNFRVLVIMKKDNSILADITKLQACTIMTVIPIRLIFVTLTDFMHPLMEVSGKWVCITYWFLEFFAVQIVLSHSLAVALLRYIFIVHNKTVVGFGKEKLKALFWYLSIGVPFLTTIWVATDLQDVLPSNHINRCNGNDHKMFLMRSWSSLGLVATNFHIQNSEMSSNVEKLIAILRKSSRVAHRIWRLLLSLNFVEGFVYYKLIKHMKR